MNKFDEIEEDNNQVVDKQQDESSIGEKFMVLCDQELKKIVENTQKIKVSTTIAPVPQGIQGITGSIYAGITRYSGATGYSGVTGYIGYMGVTGMQGVTRMNTFQLNQQYHLYPLRRPTTNKVKEQKVSIVKKIFTKKPTQISKFSII